MKRLITVLLFLPLLAAAQNKRYFGKATLDAGNVRCQLNVQGDCFNKDTGWTGAFEVPKNYKSKNGVTPTTIFTSGLWLGGKMHGKIAAAAAYYRDGGCDFYPGPLDSTTGNIDSLEMRKYDRVWKLRASEIDSFRKGLGSTNAILSWPGNPMDLSKRQKRNLAPFMDVNGNGVYDPLSSGGAKSDYPIIKGDQACWWVMNDNGGPHNVTNSPENLLLELRCMAYSYDNPKDTALHNTVFVDYQLISHNTQSIDSFYVGLWSDLSIGYGNNDYIGCDSARQCYFGYNGTNYDPDWDDTIGGKSRGIHHAGYGYALPTQSVVFLNHRMNHFMVYDNDFSSYGNPQNAQHFYGYLESRWKNGAPLFYDMKGGRRGWSPSFRYFRRANYSFDGDPLDTAAWNEKKAGNSPHDRRGVGSTGPFKLIPGAIETYSFAYIFSPGDSAGGPLSSVKRMQRDVPYIGSLWNGSGGYIKTGINDAQRVAAVGTIRLYPNPAHGTLRLQTAGARMQRATLYDALGRTVLSTQLNGVREAALDVSGLPEGVYGILVETESGRLRQKVVVKN